MNRSSVIGFVAGAVVGIAVTLLLVQFALVSKVFLWPAIPGAAVVMYIQGGGTVVVPSTAVLVANAAIYGFVGLLVGMLVGFIRSQKKPPLGHCQACGYDLRGNVSGVCPECGTRYDR